MKDGCTVGGTTYLEPNRGNRMPESRSWSGETGTPGQQNKTIIINMRHDYYY